MSLKNELTRLYQHISPRRRWQLLGLASLMLIGIIAEMATLGAVVPFLGILSNPEITTQYSALKKIGNFININEKNLLITAGILFCIIALAAAGIRILLMWAIYRLSYGISADLGGEVYRRTLHQPYAWHASHNTSQILTGVQNVNTVTSIIVQLMQGGVALFMTTAIMGMLLAIDSYTALIAGTGFSALYVLTTSVTRRRVEKNSQTIAKNERLRLQALQEGLGGIRDVLLDGTQMLYHKRFSALDYPMRLAQANNSFIASAPRFIIESAGMVMIVGLAFWINERDGGIGGAIPVLGALAIGAQKLLPQMQQTYSAWSTIKGNNHQLQDVLKLLDGPITSSNSIDTINNYTSPKFEITTTINTPLAIFKNVYFRYHRSEINILNKISFDIFRGARIGIVGETGSGKSTLVDIFMGLLSPSNGEIKIDGRPLNSQNLRDWQKRIAHVPQSIFLTDATIAENIAFGIPKEKIDIQRVEKAAEQAQLASFVEGLPQRYETTVGERGVRLSGGQRQRIGLARALYKQADVLVLDEATSALDDTTERAVMQALNGLGSDITVLMIAHRISTLSSCDIILKLSPNQEPRWISYDTLITESSETNKSIN